MEKSNRTLQILNAASAVLMVIATALVFLYAPRERTMGEVQRIFYFHVPSAWVSFLAFYVTFVAGTLVLSQGRGNVRQLAIAAAVSVAIAAVSGLTYRGLDESVRLKPMLLYTAAATGALGLYFLSLLIGISMRHEAHYWEMVGVSSVEVGLVFTVMTIITGSIWARPAWNTWWTWDPRLTTYTIMALIYVAYLMLRQGIDDPERRARFAAVYGIVGFISVPITFMSIRWWRTIHPVLIGYDVIFIAVAFMVFDYVVEE